MHTDFEDKHLALFCALQISLNAQIFSFRVFHPVFVAVDIFRCNCDDSDIMGCDQRPYFATDNDIMVNRITFVFSPNIKDFSKRYLVKLFQCIFHQRILCN